MHRDSENRLLIEVQSRIVNDLLSASTHQPLDDLLAQSVYLEQQRLYDEAPSHTQKQDVAFWDAIKQRLYRADASTQTLLAREIVDHYSNEVLGHFDPRVYAVATRALPPLLGVLLNASSPKRIIKDFPAFPSLERAVKIVGDTEHIRRLREIGTVVLAPTHVSNMDSPLLGYAIYRLGLPPFVYGAGFNLFSNPVIGFFMHHLGAYTVDRKKRDPLYKEVLKTYATVSLEQGYDNLFFPGGTRSRSGALERRLKLGLLGASIPAYTNNLLRNSPRPKIFVVPAALSYGLVLEAETLIEDFLKDVGKSRYIITDDEFAQPKRMFEFATDLLALDAKTYVTLGRGMDPFGNPVDDNGESLDPAGRRIDIARYVYKNGMPTHLPQRDKEYTAELGEQFKSAYAKLHWAQATHVAAYALFSLLRQANKNTDLLRLLGTSGRREDFSLMEVYAAIGTVVEHLRKTEVSLDDIVRSATSEEILDVALRHFGTYHRTSAAARRGDRVFVNQRSLLFYYHNRLEGYGLHRQFGLLPALSSDHRTINGGRA